MWDSRRGKEEMMRATSRDGGRRKNVGSDAGCGRDGEGRMLGAMRAADATESVKAITQTDNRN